MLEDALSFVHGMLDEYIGPKGRRYLPLVGTMFVFILLGNLMGLVPGLMAPTSNINVTLGCALTVFVYYQFHGFKEQGVVGYVRHFLAPAGAPLWIAPIYFPIEIISHLSRVLSLSVRLFGNIFGEELVILILASLVPFIVPLPMMFLGIITSSLQAFIFTMLTTIYLAGAVVVDHGPTGTTPGSGTQSRTRRTPEGGARLERLHGGGRRSGVSRATVLLHLGRIRIQTTSRRRSSCANRRCCH